MVILSSLSRSRSLSLSLLVLRRINFSPFCSSPVQGVEEGEESRGEEGHGSIVCFALEGVDVVKAVSRLKGGELASCPSWPLFAGASAIRGLSELESLRQGSGDCMYNSSVSFIPTNINVEAVCRRYVLEGE